MKVGCSWFQEVGERIHKSGLFVGCPLDLFELTSKDLFCLALMEGLNKTSKTLEIGCGCLRTGYWFIRYLDNHCYFGIEPNLPMLKAGVDEFMVKIDPVKQVRFDGNEEFDFGVFRERFDFLVAFSIWSHASKSQISKMLDEFCKVGNDGSKFITSWASPTNSTPDYVGDKWIGRSHVSDQSGFVTHAPDWLNQQVEMRNLKIRYIDIFTTISQNWLVIEK